MCRPDADLKETFDHCHWQPLQRLRWSSAIDPILFFCTIILVNITDLSHFVKQDNLQCLWLPNSVFAPLSNFSFYSWSRVLQKILRCRLKRLLCIKAAGFMKHKNIDCANRVLQPAPLTRVQTSNVYLSLTNLWNSNLTHRISRQVYETQMGVSVNLLNTSYCSLALASSTYPSHCMFFLWLFETI